MKPQNLCLVNNNLFLKLFLSLALQIKFDQRLKVTSVLIFIPKFFH